MEDMFDARQQVIEAIFMRFVTKLYLRTYKSPADDRDLYIVPGSRGRVPITWLTAAASFESS